MTNPTLGERIAAAETALAGAKDATERRRAAATLDRLNGALHVANRAQADAAEAQRMFGDRACDANVRTDR